MVIFKALTPEKIARLLREEELNPNVTITRCAKCPDWEFVGLPEDGHYAFLLHREVSHGKS